MLSFYKALFKNPKAVGAVLPSSRALARKMSTFIAPPVAGLVVELGAGTGVITEALLDRGVSDDQLVLIDSSSSMTVCLQKRFPMLRVIKGDVRNLKVLLESIEGSVHSVVSSLPLLSMTETVQNEIIASLQKVLQPGARLIQFTYRIHKPSVFSRYDRFNLIKSKRVWCNFPPARIDVYKICDG